MVVSCTINCSVAFNEINIILHLTFYNLWNQCFSLPKLYLYYVKVVGRQCIQSICHYRSKTSNQPVKQSNKRLVVYRPRRQQWSQTRVTKDVNIILYQISIHQFGIHLKTHVLFYAAIYIIIYNILLFY